MAIVQSSLNAAADFDESGDSTDLQALFDSIAATSVVAEPVASVAAQARIDDSGDSQELQALFDNVVGQMAHPTGATTTSSVVSGAQGSAQVLATDTGGTDAAASGQGAQMFNRIGQLTRELHDTLRELGYDKVMEDAARAIPDARQRLAYIVQMTEQAASRVLNAVDTARPLQEAIASRSHALSKRWDQVFANQLSAADFKALAAETQGFLKELPQQVEATNQQLTDIMMAQDFQDLTGQVIKKVVELAQKMEQQLLSVLLESIPAEQRQLKAADSDGLLNGPVVNTEGRSDIVHSQAQVDDLLESLGF